MSNALEGIRVLELGQVLAGPYAGAILADLGAEVIKIERHDGGDDARRMGPAFIGDDSLIFQVFNRGKESVALDLKSAAGIDALHGLARTADVLIHNLRPGVTAALGIDGESMTARHPRLIYCAISAFGHVGPLAPMPGYEPLIQAFSGLCAINGGPQDPPMRSGASICDQGTGMWAVIGALALLQRRQRTGRGGIVGASLLETAMAWNGQKVDSLVNEGSQPERHRTGHPGFVPYEGFDTADGPLLICCGNDRLFGKLAQELGLPGWASDPRFSTNRARLAHKAELLDELCPLLRGADRATWIARLQAAGVPCAPIHTLSEAATHEQVAALGMIQPVPLPVVPESTAPAARSLRLTALPLSIDGQRPGHRGPAPALGQHNTRFGIAGLNSSTVTNPTQGDSP